MNDFFTFETKQERPYSSIFGNDPEALKILLDVHAIENPKILDCTYNKGKMWRGIKENYNIKTLDIDPSYNTDYIGDFRNISFIAEKFDVLIFDPPHLPTNAASENSSGIWKQYGLTGDDGTGRTGDNVSDLFIPFFIEAKKILNDDGVIFCKIVDIVHNHKYQWQHIDLITAAQAQGMTACDMLIKTDPCGGNLKSNLWKNVYHLKRNHCYWIVIRNSAKCEKRKSK
jgi:hypothetical protein